MKSVIICEGITLDAKINDDSEACIALNVGDVQQLIKLGDIENPYINQVNS